MLGSTEYGSRCMVRTQVAAVYHYVGAQERVERGFTERASYTFATPSLLKRVLSFAVQYSYNDIRYRNGLKSIRASHIEHARPWNTSKQLLLAWEAVVRL